MLLDNEASFVACLRHSGVGQEPAMQHEVKVTGIAMVDGDQQKAT